MSYGIEELNRDTSLYFGGGAVEASPTKHYKGGKGGGSAKASLNYQRAVDAENKRRMIAATNAVNSIFDNSDRERQYQQQRDAVYNLNADAVRRQAAEAERNNRFGLARAGLLGGSADIDSTSDINYRTNKGLLQAQGIADDSAASLKTQDEQTRQNLLSLANSGIDASSAATMATNQLKSNLDNAASAKAAATIGNLFSTMPQTYLMASALKSQNQASPLSQYYKSAYGNDPHNTYPGSPN